MLDPKSFTDTLQKKYNFKLKGTGPIDFHLGQSFSRNDDGEMEISAKCYIDKMIDTYVQLYGEKPRKASSPLEQNDHLEMDDSPFLGQDETQQFQSLIGAMQRAVSIRRLDIATAVMSLSSFCTMPRRGHLERAKQIYGYLQKMKEARIRVLTNEPDYSDYQDPEYNWSSSVYGDVKEIIPMDIPEPKGKYVTLSHYFDANLYHDMVTGRSVTAILHFLNQTPMDWYSKKQAMVETATFGSEFIAARTTINQIVNPTCQATQETQCSIIPSCTRGSRIQVCYDLPSARQIQPCRHPQQALGLCFGMANHECTPICSRRYMGSFR
jgi:hypothetical protein